MNFSALHNRLERLPMLRAFVPFAAGILLAEYYTLPAIFVWAGFILCGIGALTMRSSLYTAAALLLFGCGVADGLHTSTPDNLPRGVRTEFSLSIDDGGSGQVTAWRNEKSKRWEQTNIKIIVRTDSTLTLQTGERIVVRGYLNDFPDKHPSYGRLMQRRGYAATVWLSHYSILERTQSKGATLHSTAVGRLRKLGLPEKEHALCAAMSTGDRSGLTPELRSAYSRSGTSHLLAVSGLHVGIVFLLVNGLLWWLPALRRGHLLRNAAAIALIWLYAATAGLSPSVVRAALMFSALQLSLASTSAYVSGNVLAGTAFAMLLFRPSYLFDISFQLSFIAVAAILAWGVPLCRRLHSRHAALNALTATLAIGVVSATATAPLVAHTFGIVSLIGIVVNPLVIPLAGVVVLSSVVWIIAPIPAVAPIVRLIAGTAAKWQNTLAEQTASMPYGSIEWMPTTGATAAIYLAMILLTLSTWCLVAKKTVPLER